MITINTTDCNDISQKSYSRMIHSLELSSLPCPVCHHAGEQIIHGYYTRCLKTSSGSQISLRIMRTRCCSCHHTHAILPSSIVPYSKICLSDHCRILQMHEEGCSASDIADEVPSADENNVKSIIRRFLLHWLQRLLSCSIPLFPLQTLIMQCFSVYSRQFLQIHRTPNILFPKTT